MTAGNAAMAGEALASGPADRRVARTGAIARNDGTVAAEPRHRPMRLEPDAAPL